MDVQYNVYQCLQSYTIKSFANIYYFLTSFDFICSSSTGSYTIYYIWRSHVGDLMATVY